MEEQRDTNGWNEYKRLVLKQLEDLTDGQRRIEDKQDCLKNDLTILKTKVGLYAGLIGLGGGVVVQIALIIIKALH